MFDICFDEGAVTEQGLRLRGPVFCGLVQLVDDHAGGAWRLFFWQRLEDADKSSWAIEQRSLLPFESLATERGYKLKAASAPELTLQLAPLSAAVSGGAELERLTAQSAPAHAEEFEELDPVTDVGDGLTLGCGLVATLRETSDRRYYGLGERTGGLDKRGRRWTNWNTDDPTHLPQTDPLYQAHPFLIGCEPQGAFGLYLDETFETVFDLAASAPDRSLIRTAGPTFDLYLLAGPTVERVVRRFTALVGRAPLPPLWALGYQQCRYSYADERAARAVVDEFRRRDIPLDALWLDIEHMDGYKVFSFHPRRFADPRKFTDDLRSRGVRTVTIVDPGVKREPGYAVYDSGRELGAFVGDRYDRELVGRCWPPEVVWPDFTRADVRRWWGELHRHHLDAGVAGIWNDMNEPSAFAPLGEPPTVGGTLPRGARHGDRGHGEVHNVYGQQMCRATYEGWRTLAPERRPFVLTRSGFSGVQRYAWVWTGDNHSWWEHLEMSIPMLLNLGLSGVAFCGADIGGFGGDADGELVARWSWLGAFYPLMRNHCCVGSRQQQPWSFGERYERSIREAILFRYRLLPYLYELAHRHAADGLPLMRPLLLEFPDDDQVGACSDQFMLGDALLVAPALRSQQTHRAVYLPAGGWTEFFSGEQREGPGWQVVETPLDRIPLFIRQGRAVPLTAPAMHTTDARWAALRWRTGLAPEISGRVYSDAGEGPADGTVGTLEGDYDAQDARLRLVHRDPSRGGAPVAVELLAVDRPADTGVELSYDAEARTATLSLVPNVEAEVRW